MIAHRGRIPAGGDESHRLAVARFGDIEERDVVGVSVGDEQDLAVRCQGEAVGRIARGRVRVERGIERLQRLAGGRVEDADARRVGAGDVVGRGLFPLINA